jgi:hypothetical protein
LKTKLNPLNQKQNQQPRQQKQETHQSVSNEFEPECSTKEDTDLMQLLEHDQEIIERQITTLISLPSYQHLSEEQLIELAASLFRFSTIMYEIASGM